MGGRNYERCHSCRAKDYFFVECPRKCRCPTYKHGFKKCFVVEKEINNKGRLFLCCCENCGFWEWVVKEQASSQSSRGSASSKSPATNETVEDMSNMFESRFHLNDQELHISMRVTTCKASAEVKAREKGST